MQKIKITLWLRKKLNRRARLIIAFVSLIIFVAALFIILPGFLPRFVITLGGRLSFKTPAGFSVGNIYSFAEKGVPEISAASKEGKIPYMDEREIPFRYPEIKNLDNMAYSEDALMQSMDFKLKKFSGDGLVQIWTLAGSAEDFINGFTNNKKVTCQAFKSARSDVAGIKGVTWNYTFKSGGNVIHGLETFFSDDKNLYRVSLFVPEKNYETIKNVYAELIKSVSLQ